MQFKYIQVEHANYEFYYLCVYDRNYIYSIFSRLMLYAENIATQNSWFRELEKLIESSVKTTDYFGKFSKI